VTASNRHFLGSLLLGDGGRRAVGVLEHECLEAAGGDCVEHVDHRVGVGHPVRVAAAALGAAGQLGEVAVDLADHVFVLVLALGSADVAGAPLHLAEAQDALTADLAHDRWRQVEGIDGCSTGRPVGRTTSCRAAW
jgi:hypothetical protein